MKSDVELMLAFAEGDEEAFDELVGRHQVALVNFFHKMLWNHHAAEDLAQEVLVKLYTCRERYEPRAKFTTFLYRIARNCAVDFLRKTRRERGVLSLDAHSDDAIAHEQAGPAETADRNEQTAAVRAAIEALPEDHRLVLVLSEVQGLKYAQISEVLGVPVGTVKSRMHNAIKKLRDRLVRQGQGSGIRD